MASETHHDKKRDLEKCLQPANVVSTSNHARHNISTFVIVCFNIVLLTTAVYHELLMQEKYNSLKEELDSVKQLVNTLLQDRSMVTSPEEKDLDSDGLQGSPKYWKENNDVQGEEIKINTDVQTVQIDEDNSIILERSKRSRSNNNNNNRRRHNNRGKKGGNKKKDKKNNKNRVNQDRQLNQILAYNLHSSPQTSFDGSKFIDWQPSADMIRKAGSLYSYTGGDLTVHRKGVYFIYSQVTYRTSYPTVSYSVKKTDASGESTTIYKCVNSVEIATNNITGSNSRYQHCYSARAVLLEQNDKVFVTDDHGVIDLNEYRTVDFKPEYTFWGMFKLYDLED